MSVARLIDLLSDGDCHSGETLAAALGVSRTAVWKQLKHLEQYGLDAVAVKGRGYRLSSPIELLSIEKIDSYLSGDIKERLGILHLSLDVDSTNKKAMSLIEAHSRPAACLAEQQTAGRGRRGKTWQSPFAQNLYLSIAWPFSQGVQVLEGLSLAVGVVVAEALVGLGFQGVQLKWPNDIVWRGKKLGGILIEVGGDMAGPCHVVVGLGLNVSMSADAAKDIDQPWVSLLDIAKVQSPNLSVELSRNHVAGELTEAISQLLFGFMDDGFSVYHSRWESLDAYSQQSVEVVSDSKRVAGVADGVAINGALKLKLDDGSVQLCHGGEVSLRLRAPMNKEGVVVSGQGLA